jgi:4-amino-4-deoxy-L-arabinose transferase-like glycosyltransferase
MVTSIVHRAAMLRSRLHIVCLICILCCSLALGATSLRREGRTYDERYYYGQGKDILSTGSWERPAATLHPPLSFYLHSPPLFLRHDQRELFNLNRARFCLLLASMVPLVVLSFWWASQLFGRPSGLLAACLVGLSPNLMAHARLITPDATLACWWLGALALWWRFLTKGGTGRLVASAVALGLALLSKYTALLLVPLFPVVGLALTRRKPLRVLGTSVGAVTIALTVLAAGYGFRRIPTRLGSMEPRSETFSSLAGNRWLRDLPLPLPRPYLEGVDFQSWINEGGWPAFLMGGHSDRGWWYYFLVAIAVKTPLALFGLLALRLGTRHSRDDLCLLIPSVALLLYSSFLIKVQIGLRYVLPIYPLLMIYASGCVASTARWRRWAVPPLVAWFVVAGLSIHPHYLAYFNELIGGPRNGYRYLIDSNLDWGQDDKAAREFAEASREPVHVNPDCDPVTGLVLVSANRLQGLLVNDDGVTTDTSCYYWLRRLKPIGHVGFSYLLFRVPPAAEADAGR